MLNFAVRDAHSVALYDESGRFAFEIQPASISRHESYIEVKTHLINEDILSFFYSSQDDNKSDFERDTDLSNEEYSYTFENGTSSHKTREKCKLVIKNHVRDDKTQLDRLMISSFSSVTVSDYDILKGVYDNYGKVTLYSFKFIVERGSKNRVSFSKV